MIAYSSTGIVHDGSTKAYVKCSFDKMHCKLAQTIVLGSIRHMKSSVLELAIIATLKDQGKLNFVHKH